MLHRDIHVVMETGVSIIAKIEPTIPHPTKCLLVNHMCLYHLHSMLSLSEHVIHIVGSTKLGQMTGLRRMARGADGGKHILDVATPCLDLGMHLWPLTL